MAMYDFVDESGMNDQCVTREEWALRYLALFPDACAMFLIGAYNSQDGLGDRLGWFSLQEAQEITAKFQSSRA